MTCNKMFSTTLLYLSQLTLPQFTLAAMHVFSFNPSKAEKLTDEEVTSV